MGRVIKMYCVDVSNDESEFELRFEVGGKVVDKEVVYSFDDVLYISYEFFKKNCEKYNFDGRFDTLEVSINKRYN